MKFHAGIVVLIVVAIGGGARADVPVRESGFIAKPPPQMKIDDCAIRDPSLTEDQLRAQGAEHYTRGETLYLQGDYPGAVAELIDSYCKIPYYSILKDIGQAYERSLDYELAIAYLERYIHDVPDDAKRPTPCSAEPQEDKKNVERRVKVLRDLKAHVLVQTNPEGAQITVENAERVISRSVAGKDIPLLGDRYQVKIDLPGYEIETHRIDVQIGKPYTYFYNLTPLTGKLSVQVTPPDARIFLDNRLVNVGSYEATLDAKTYEVMTEHDGRITQRKQVQVLPNQVTRTQIEMTPTPQFGRRQLIVFSTLGGSAATGALLFAFNNTGIAGLGTVAGAAAGFASGYFYLPESVSLGTSNLTITTSLAGAVVGATAAVVFTDDQRIIQPIAGASAIIGAGAGYYFGERTKIRPGDAALINSAMTWGTVAGGLFAVSFDPPRDVAGGLVLSGIGMGAISGVVLTRYFDISRTHAVLIDVGGVVGILGGLAAESLAYPTTQVTGGGQVNVTNQQREHLANFSLGGMAIGLIGAGILTRNLDSPNFALKPAIGNVTATDGSKTTTFGLGGSW